MIAFGSEKKKREKNLMKKPAMLVLLIMLLSILGGCGDQGNPVVKTITSKNGSSKTDYSIVYDNGKIGNCFTA